MAILAVLVRRHRRAVGAAVRRAADEEEETGPAVVRNVPQGRYLYWCALFWSIFHPKKSKLLSIDGLAVILIGIDANSPRARFPGLLVQYHLVPCLVSGHPA